MNGLTRARAWPCVARRARWRSVTAGERLPRSLVGHDGEVDVDRAPRPSSGGDGVGDPPRDLGPERAAGDGERDGDLHRVRRRRRRPGPCRGRRSTVQLGVLDRPEGLEDLALVGTAAAPRDSAGRREISTTSIGRIPAWQRPRETSDHRVGPAARASSAPPVTAVTTAFGDPTRRDIYLFVRAGRRGR